MGSFITKFLDALKLDDDEDDELEVEDVKTQKASRETKKNTRNSDLDQTKERVAVKRDTIKQPPMRREAVVERETTTRIQASTRAEREQAERERLERMKLENERLERDRAERAERVERSERNYDNYSQERVRERSLNRSRVVSDSEITIIAPRRFEDSQDICDMLKSGKAIILNLGSIDMELGQRIMDFVSGTIYALDARIYQIEACMFCLSPENVEVSGDYINSISASGFKINESSRAINRTNQSINRQ